MKLKLAPKIAIPIAAMAVVATATPGVAMAMTAAPATTAVNARTEHPAAPTDLGPWTEYRPATDSPTQAACNGIGQGLNVATYKCLQYEFDGYTTVWDLWFRIG
jgi:hypothetical protein